MTAGRDPAVDFDIPVDWKIRFVETTYCSIVTNFSERDRRKVLLQMIRWFNRDHQDIRIEVKGHDRTNK